MERGNEVAGNDRAFIERCLRVNELFGRWSDEGIAALVGSGHIERYARRMDVLALQPQRRVVAIVAEGCLEVSRVTVEGKRFLLTLLGPGLVTRLVQLHGPEPVPYSFYAHEGTTIVHWPAETLLAVLDASPALWKEVALLLLARQRDFVRMLHDDALGTSQLRVAATLASLSRLSGAREDRGSTMRLRLSQDDLGAMLGMSRQTVSKELRALEEGGVIAADYSRITIRDVDALHRLAGRTRGLPAP